MSQGPKGMLIHAQNLLVEHGRIEANMSALKNRIWEHTLEMIADRLGVDQTARIVHTVAGFAFEAADRDEAATMCLVRDTKRFNALMEESKICPCGAPCYVSSGDVSWCVHCAREEEADKREARDAI